MADAYWYNYSGKPKGKLEVPAGAYKKLDAVTKDPVAVGLEGHMIYFNTAMKWKANARGATIRVKYVRADGDATGYQSFYVGREGLLSEQFLATHIHWESGSKIGGRWSVRVDGDVTGMTLDTRYAKIYVVRK